MTHLSFYKPIFLLYHGGLTSSFDQSDFQDRDAAESAVPAPYTVGETSFTFNPHSMVQTFFTQEFWDTAFKKYGSAALRSMPDVPPRVAWFSAVESTTFHSSLGELTFISPESREWINDFIVELQESGQKVIAQYIKALIYDAWKFPMLAKRFVEIAENWFHRGERLAAQAMRASMIAFEAAIFFIYEHKSISTDDKRRDAKIFHAQWCKLRGHRHVEPDEVSALLGGTVDQFISSVLQGEENTYDERIVKSLMDYSRFLHQELCIQEAMVAQLYELPAGFWEHYVNGIPGHQLIWRTRNHNIIVQLTRLLGNLNRLQAHLPTWRSEWQAKVLSWICSFRNISHLISQDMREVHMNWREVLHTVPMLRKSKRRVWERWYFLAKRAMINLKGDQLAKLEEFEQRYAGDFNLNSYKIVLPGRSAHVQGVAEKWAGLLDNIVEFERDEGELMEDLGQEEMELLTSLSVSAGIAATKTPQVRGRHRAQQLCQVMATAEQNGQRLQSEQAESYCREAHNQLASTTLSWRYQLQEARRINDAPLASGNANEPQITRALMEDHPVPYTGSGSAIKRNWDLYGNPLDIYDVSASKKRSSAVPPRKIDRLSQLMAEVNRASNDNVHRPAGRTPQLIRRRIQISGNVLDELAASVQQDADMVGMDDEVLQQLQANRFLASEIQDAVKGHRKTLNEAAGYQQRAHELAREERDKAAMQRGLE